MKITISDKYQKEVNGITRCFIVVDDKECKIPKEYYESLVIGKTYDDETASGYYKIDENSKWLVPLGNYIK